MDRKKTMIAGVSGATLALLFGAGASQAATLSPSVQNTTGFSEQLVAADNNNNNNNPHQLAAASKPAMLESLALQA